MRRDSDGKMHRVRYNLGVPGYIVTATAECSGCTEYGEYGGPKWGPYGCSECGHTGRVRHRYFVPFDVHAHARAMERRSAKAMKSD